MQRFVRPLARTCSWAAALGAAIAGWPAHAASSASAAAIAAAPAAAAAQAHSVQASRSHKEHHHTSAHKSKGSASRHSKAKATAPAKATAKASAKATTKATTKAPAKTSAKAKAHQARPVRAAPQHHGKEKRRHAPAPASRGGGKRGASAAKHAVRADAGRSSAVNVQVNDTPLQGLQPVIDSAGNLIVPVRPVAEALGAAVAADEYKGAIHIALTRRERRLDLFCGSGMALMNGLPDAPEAVPALKDGTATAALRTLLRWSGAECVWDAQSRTAFVSTDGRRHAPAAALAAEEAKPGLILQTAEAYRGVPYVWGGTRPAGFDCSGFVQYVYRRHGVELPRTSREMFAVGDAVQELEPGDLVFFCTVGNTTSHVGIYIGDNRFISATTSYGVHIASLHSTYWGPKFIGAKRVL